MSKTKTKTLTWKPLAIPPVAQETIDQVWGAVIGTRSFVKTHARHEGWIVSYQDYDDPAMQIWFHDDNPFLTEAEADAAAEQAIPEMN